MVSFRFWVAADFVTVLVCARLSSSAAHSTDNGGTDYRYADAVSSPPGPRLREVHGNETVQREIPDPVCETDEYDNVPTAFERTPRSLASRRNLDMVLPTSNVLKETIQQGRTRLRIPEPHLPQYSSQREAIDAFEPRVPRNRTSFFSSNPSEDDQDIVEEESGPQYEFPREISPERSPVIYRYYGKSRGRVHTLDSVPFILLGPSVDHWKTAGQTLSARGFSAIACERIERESKEEPNNLSAEGASLVLAVMDSLRWNKAILVGCDEESALAAAAALQLAPERVAGIVLCGDITSVEQLFSVSGQMNVDEFLRQNLGCPFSIVWGGDVSPGPGQLNPVDIANRCLILGGGSAPHRRLPEQFAWALTRFVEEEVSPRALVEVSPRPKPRKRFSLPLPFKDVFSAEGLVFTGHILSRVILFVSALRVAFYQYENIHDGFMSIKFQYRRFLKRSKDLVLSISGYLCVPFRSLDISSFFRWVPLKEAITRTTTRLIEFSNKGRGILADLGENAGSYPTDLGEKTRTNTTGISEQGGSNLTDADDDCKKLGPAEETKTTKDEDNQGSVREEKSSKGRDEPNVTKNELEGLMFLDSSPMV